MEPRNQGFPRRTNQADGTSKNPPRNRAKSRKKKNQNRLHRPNQGGQRTPKLILDSNIIAKLVLNEPNSKEARASIKGYSKKGYSLYTVDIAFAECLNVIWKHATLLSDLNSEDTKSATEYLRKVFNGLNIIPTQELVDETINIAQTKKTPVYDALYIALAQKANGTLYTADQKLCSLAKTIVNTKLLQP